MHNIVNYLYIQAEKINYITDHIFNHIFKFSVHPPALNLKAGGIAQCSEFVFFKKYNTVFLNIFKIDFPLKE